MILFIYRTAAFIVYFLSPLQALNLLTFLGQNPHSAPDLDMYNNFLNGCAEIGSMVHANTCLDLMENQMVGKSEMTYLELLKVCRIIYGYIISYCGLEFQLI